MIRAAAPQEKGTYCWPDRPMASDCCWRLRSHRGVPFRARHNPGQGGAAHRRRGGIGRRRREGGLQADSASDSTPCLTLVPGSGTYLPAPVRHGPEMERTRRATEQVGGQLSQHMELPSSRSSRGNQAGGEFDARK